MIEEKSPPKFFVQGTSTLLRMVFFAALSISMMAADARFHYLAKMRQVGVLVLQPLQWVANRPEAIYQGVSEYLRTQSSLRDELTELKTQSLFQSAKLQQLQSLEDENNHLKSLLTLTSYADFHVKPAQIIALINNVYRHKVMIDQGEKAGVVEGQPVIDEQGVIGQVTRVFSFSSEVTLLTDREFTIPIQVERNGLRAIANGEGNRSYISLPYLPSNVDLQKGDRLVTSGIDGVYPAGLLVAEIDQIKISNNTPFAIVHASPIGGVHNFRQVLLIEPLQKTPALNEAGQIKQQAQNSGADNKKSPPPKSTQEPKP